MLQYKVAQAAAEQKAKCRVDCFREQIIALLPQLSAFAHCLAGNSERRDDLVRETYARALAHKDQCRPDTHFESWMFRIALNLWFDRKHGKKFRSEPAGIELADFLAGRDGWAVTEKLVFADLLKAIDHLSPEDRVLIALVCVNGFTYAEAADILSLPVGTVISRLVRGRLALHDAVKAVTAASAACPNTTAS